MCFLSTFHNLKCLDRLQKRSRTETFCSFLFTKMNAVCTQLLMTSRLLAAKGNNYESYSWKVLTRLTAPIWYWKCQAGHMTWHCFYPGHVSVEKRLSLTLKISHASSMGVHYSRWMWGIINRFHSIPICHMNLTIA